MFGVRMPELNGRLVLPIEGLDSRSLVEDCSVREARMIIWLNWNDDEM